MCKHKLHMVKEYKDCVLLECKECGMKGSFRKAVPSEPKNDPKKLNLWFE